MAAQERQREALWQHARTPSAARTEALQDLRLAHFRRQPELLPIVALGDIRKQLAGRRHARRAARLRHSRAMTGWLPACVSAQVRESQLGEQNS